MSAKNRGHESIANDLYPTPPHLVDAALAKLKDAYPHFRPKRVLEPGCGSGIHLDKAVEYFPSIETVVGIDLDPECVLDPAYLYVSDDYTAWSPELEDGRVPAQYDLIVTNPPFSLAEMFIRRSVLDILAPGGICMFLIREPIVGGKDRTKCLWREVNLRGLWQLDRRPSFVGGNDATEYAYILFDGGLPGRPVFDWLVWREPKRRRSSKRALKLVENIDR